MAMGGLAWAFTVRWGQRARGLVLSLLQLLGRWNEFTPLLIAKPMPFPFSLIPRANERVEEARDMFVEVRDRVHRQQAKVEIDMSKFKDSMETVIKFINDAECPRGNEKNQGAWLPPLFMAIGVECTS